MNAQPVRRYRPPAYPTRLQALEQPLLLEEHQPPAWRRPEMAGAVSAFLALNACVQSDPGDGIVPEGQMAAIVAPLFQHGEGRGATGCIVVTPPVFLSEEEALQILTEELGLHGVTISDYDVVLDGVFLQPQVEREVIQDDDPGAGIEPAEGAGPAPFLMDGLDPEKRIGFEFVARDDYHELGGRRSFSTVQGYDLVGVGAALSKEVEKKGQGLYFGVFYDPMERIDFDRSAGVSSWKKVAKNARTQSRRLLRQQVKDFLDWLQAQGAI